ncbi:TPA: hypothetical protein ACOTG0_001166 [Clostridium perfringens]
MIKFKFRKKYLLYCLGILFLPIIFISLLSIFIKLGTTYINTNEIIIDLNKAVDIGDYLTCYVAILGIEVTAVFSYMLFKTSLKSNELAKAINDKEENRDKEIIKESAMIIYYDLRVKLDIIKNLYTKYFLHEDIEINREIVMIDHWLKNLANLRSFLDKREMDIIFELYNRIELISRIQNSDEKQLKKLIKGLSKEIFINKLLDYLWMDYHGENECLLKIKYYTIFYKIEEKISSNLVKQKEYVGELNNLSIINGKESWKDKNGNLIYEFNYVDGIVTEGKFLNYVNNKYRVVFDGILEDEFTGLITEFYKSKKVKYRGYMKSGKYEGKGIEFINDEENKPFFKGYWKNGIRDKGEYKRLKDKYIIYFNGTYKNNIPYSGKIESTINYNLNGTNIYGFNGIIENGKAIKGFGYKESNRIIDWDYINKHPEYDYYNYEEYDEKEFSEDIPEEIIQEIHEESERDSKLYKLSELQMVNVEVLELLGGIWEDGSYKAKEDDLLNKEFIGLNPKRIDR